MKRPDGTVVCDRCHLSIAPKAPDHLNYGKTDYHAACYCAYRREKQPRVQFDEVRAVVLIIALMWMLVPFAPKDDLYAQSEPGDVHGAYFTYGWNSGRFAWEPFVKIAHPKLSPSEDGEPEIWGFRPWNLEPPDEKGLTPPVNIIEARFIPCDGRMHNVTIKHPNEPGRKVERSIKCPDHLWR